MLLDPTIESNLLLVKIKKLHDRLDKLIGRMVGSKNIICQM